MYKIYSVKRVKSYVKHINMMFFPPLGKNIASKFRPKNLVLYFKVDSVPAFGLNVIGFQSPYRNLAINTGFTHFPHPFKLEY